MATSDGSIVSSNGTWRGAGEIALHVLGEDTPANRRKIYNWLERRSYPHRPVTYRFGSVLCMDARDYFDWLAQTKMAGATKTLRRKVNERPANDTGANDEDAA